MALAPEHAGIGIRRHFTTDGTRPYDQVRWERRDARITNYRDGSVAFEQRGVEFPTTWSVNATNIVAQKYFRGTVGTPEREWSLRQVIDRVADTITRWGIEGGYFADDAESVAFNDELKHLLVTQKAAFNSPVWFNIGVKGVPQQASACFILSVDDSMDSILNWYREEGVIFKGGSGAGVNLSRIRSSAEPLKGGGTASGPVSFMRGADASAGTIKSGGKTRRAAKMVILDVDHPDVEEFIWCKALEERKARVLEQAGFDMDLDGRDSHSLQYQNANNSVRVTDEFMQAVVDDADWHLRERTTGRVVRTVRAREIFRQLARATWECADPGMQFDTTINHWHTAATTGRINGSNPCSEYMHLDDSACNLASLNLLAFLDQDETFDVDGFRHAVEVMFTGQEILVGRADYPTETIADTSRRFRQLGLGYANLGALLMALGLPYDSDAGRAYAAAVTSLMTGHAYEVSARIASRMGPFAGFADNSEHMLRVLRQHQEAAARIDEELVPPELLSAAQESWDMACELGDRHGVRNSQASVLAPTGCLVGGSLVSTSAGLVRLGGLGDPDGDRWQDVDLDVLTDEGARPATRFYVNGIERVVDVVTERGYGIRGTTTHRIKVVDGDTGEWVWRRFADLRPGDRVPLARGRLVGRPQRVALPPVSPAPAGERHPRAPRHMTPDLAELAGYALGAGSWHARGLRLHVDDGDLDVADHLARLAKGLFGIPAQVTSGGGSVTVDLASARLAEWWRACGLTGGWSGAGGGAAAPHVPDAVLRSNDPEVYRSFVRGLFEAGGTVPAGYPTWTTPWTGLAGEVQSLLLALGLVTERRHGPGGDGTPRWSVRPLQPADRERWRDDIGFVSGRRARAVAAGHHRRAGRGDHVPVPRALIERVAPAGDPRRAAALAAWRRGGAVARDLATELHDRSGDAELGHLLGFFYDRVATAEPGDEEPTFDLSVPANVTYVANGFVSHNTIGLMMDCDTTGIEPDLGLVKTKKLVGGGTMSIVNQTVPRALEQLGYGPGEIDDIVAHIDEHKSILGAPHLLAEHLPVFACSMGDNPIHYSGHVRMMAAVQPFISGAISKTVNMPEEATVEEVEQLHVDAWRMGVKAIAIYRDNCKVGQPLSATKAAGAATPEAAAAGAATGTPAVAAAGAVEPVTTQVVEKIIKVPVREKMPRNRTSRTFEFRVADCKGFVTVGEYDDGRPGEIFLKVSKQGSTLSGIMDAFSISVSYGLQYGVPLRSYVEAFTNTRFEPAGITDDADLRIATSLLDYIFRRLAVNYLSYEERAELGILTTGERTQPTLPGVEETAIQTRQGQDVPADPPSIDSSSPTLFDTASAPREPSLLERAGVPEAERRTDRQSPAIQRPVTSSDAPYCMQCGVQMQRAGSCHACPSCGSTSGCS
jgi:ribonucleoside-diphosphate reductase alpha chain